MGADMPPPGVCTVLKVLGALKNPMGALLHHELTCRLFH